MESFALEHQQGMDDGANALVEDSSMRVEYEDPMQKEEKMRLMKLFGGANGAPGDASAPEGVHEDQKPTTPAGGKKKLVRRVTRKSGGV
jgi:hypothetical protein